MATRKTKDDYINEINKLAKKNHVTIKTDLKNKEKIILKTRIAVYHADCDKTRNCKVGSFLKWPQCQYCSKVKRNESVTKRREKVYSKYPKPKKGERRTARKISSSDLKKVGPLKEGYFKVNDKATAGEREIARVLKELRVSYTIEEPIWLNSHSKTPLRADFCVKLNGKKFIIEYDGEQHFRAVKAYGGARGYYRRLKLDEAKDNFVKRHKEYEILRIPYWEYKNIEYHIRKYLPL